MKIDNRWILAPVLLVFSGCCCGPVCGPAPCGPRGCGPPPLLHHLGSQMRCASGCGEIYLGEWHADPPTCDPCDCNGHWTGHGCCGLSFLQKLWGIRYEGGYYLTYHRWANRRQVLACYPQMPELLRRKRQFDPEDRFQSDWYRHYRAMFADLV